MLRIDALLKQFIADQFEAEPVAQVVAGLLLSLKVSPWLSALFWSPWSVNEPSAVWFATVSWPTLLLSLVSRRSIIRDTLAIPALTSLRTSEKPLLPSSCTLWKWLLISWVEQVEMVKVKIYEHTFTKYWSSQMKYKIEEWSLDVSYFIDMALNFDFRDSEIDWRSDGPAPSWFIGEEWLVELLQTDKKWSYKCLAKKSIQ